MLSESDDTARDSILVKDYLIKIIKENKLARK